MANLDQSGTQSEFGKLVGISQPAVSDLISRSILANGQPMGVWLLQYCMHLREVAAGRASSGDLDLVQERARLAKEQADKVAMLNARARRELAPVYVLEQALANACRQIAGILEAIPVNLKRRVKNLSAEELEFITREIVQARNLAASAEITLEDLEDGPERDHESDPPGPDSFGGS